MTDPVDTDALRESAVDADHIAGWFRDRGNEEERSALDGCRDRLTAAADEVDRLRSRFIELEAMVVATSTDRRRLRGVIENAPHEPSCWLVDPQSKWTKNERDCTCWKANAL